VENSGRSISCIYDELVNTGVFQSNGNFGCVAELCSVDITICRSCFLIERSDCRPGHSHIKIHKFDSQFKRID
jgi:hypothetical protein